MQQSSRLSFTSSGVTTKQPTQSTCYLQHTLMDLHLTPGVGQPQQNSSNSTPQTDAVAPDVTETETITSKFCQQID